MQSHVLKINKGMKNTQKVRSDSTKLKGHVANRITEIVKWRVELPLFNITVSKFSRSQNRRNNVYVNVGNTFAKARM